MPNKGTSRKKLQRILKVHQLLRNGNSLSANELVEYLLEIDESINERTVRADIQTLRDLGATISGHRFTGFAYQKPFSLLRSLEEVDTAEMDEVISFVRQMAKSEAAFFELDKLLLQFEQRVRTAGYLENPFIAFEHVNAKNIERLDEFYRYVTEQRIREIDYTPFGYETEKRIVLPVQLREFNNRWTLVAYDKEKTAYQNFPLDRIGKVRLSAETFVNVHKFDGENHFKDIIGNTVMEVPLETITFTMQKRRAFYVETKPWHVSQQKINEDENSMTFEIKIRPNNEFWAKVMEHMEDIEILSPQFLRDELLKKVTEIYKRFTQRTH
jgi:predicted DNA-binding transcriptional regulator YafY